MTQQRAIAAVGAGAVRNDRQIGPVTEYLAVRIAGELFAVPLADVREISVPPQITRVPRAPREVLGVVSLRGLLITVVDPRRKLHLAPDTGGKRGRILVIPMASGETMGLYVDEVLQVYRLAEHEIEPAQQVLGTNLAEYVTAIARRDDALLIILALPPLLATR